MTAPRTEFKLADLDGLERLIYGRAGEDRIAENDAAFKALLEVLRSLGAGGWFVGYPEPSTAQWTRLASAITALFVNPGFRLTQDGFNALAESRSVLESVYKASAYGSSDYVFGLIGDQSEGLTKYLMLFSSSSELNLDLEAAFRMDPQATIGLWLSLVSYGQTFTPAGDARREHLLSLWPIFEGVDLPHAVLNTLCAAYMHCSYAHGERKHDIKGLLHRLVKGIMPQEARPLRGVAGCTGRPTVMVVLDWWWSKHAMYRCYAQAIRSLKRDFRVVGIGRMQVTDDEARAVFDEFHDVPSEGMVLQDIAASIRKVAPDILYFPSIGMSMVTIAMASLRLAPIQVMTYGHPATSMSPDIQYGILESDVCVPERFSEHMIPLPPGSIRFVPYEKHTVRHLPRDTDAVKIAVSAMQVKITWPFVRALQEVQRLAKKKVEIHLLTAVNGIGMWSFAAEIKKLLANTMVYQKADYREYLEWIAACDLCLFSFPFGGANSVIDAFSMGIPVVSLEGDEPHSRTDSTLIRRAGLPEDLIAKSEGEYVERILSLLDDDERARVAGLIRAVDVAKLAFAPDESNAFADAFLRLYESQAMEKAA